MNCVRCLIVTQHVACFPGPCAGEPHACLDFQLDLTDDTCQILCGNKNVVAEIKSLHFYIFKEREGALHHWAFTTA